MSDSQSKTERGSTWDDEEVLELIHTAVLESGLIIWGAIVDKSRSRIKYQVKNSRSVVKNLRSLVKNWRSLVKNSRSVVKNLRSLVKNLQSLVKNSQSVVKNSRSVVKS